MVHSWQCWINCSFCDKGISLLQLGHWSMQCCSPLPLGLQHGKILDPLSMVSSPSPFSCKSLSMELDMKFSSSYLAWGLSYSSLYFCKDARLLSENWFIWNCCNCVLTIRSSCSSSCTLNCRLSNVFSVCSCCDILMQNRLNRISCTKFACSSHSFAGTWLATVLQRCYNCHSPFCNKCITCVCLLK